MKIIRTKSVLQARVSHKVDCCSYRHLKYWHTPFICVDTAIAITSTRLPHPSTYHTVFREHTHRICKLTFAHHLLIGQVHTLIAHYSERKRPMRTLKDMD